MAISSEKKKGGRKENRTQKRVGINNSLALSYPFHHSAKIIQEREEEEKKKERG